jgi:protein-S-isoprenylcysteine O-methyltransferase Ste14
VRASHYIIKHLAIAFSFVLILFISAGHIDYLQGWVYVIIGLVMFVVRYTVLRVGTELLNERSRPGEGAKKWDKLLIGISFLIVTILFITTGLDSGRYHWSSELHWSFYMLGIILTITGQLLFLIAQKQNKFFSSTVRIQTERGHTVCETGLYKSIRHPAYLGNILQALGFPLLFGSLWSLIPVCISILLVLIRTYLEDRTLINELNGYCAYTLKTRYKIIPYFW